MLFRSLASAGAAVGLGSIWRFPYLTGANGGSAFVFIFILACLAIATPLLIAEFIIGRRSRRSPPEAAGEVARSFGRSRRWNIIGILGTVATFLIMSYYTVIAGWVLAYAWKCASGEITALPPRSVAGHFRGFLASLARVLRGQSCLHKEGHGQTQGGKGCGCTHDCRCHTC